MSLARSESFPLISWVSKPFIPRSTTKPWTTSPTLAQTTARSAIVAFVIHILVPLRIQRSPFFSARVAIPPGFDPKSGSVSPKQPIISPFCSLGSQRSFWASLPKAWMGYITRALWTEAKLRTPESPRSSSCMHRP